MVDTDAEKEPPNKDNKNVTALEHDSVHDDENKTLSESQDESQDTSQDASHDDSHDKLSDSSSDTSIYDISDGVITADVNNKRHMIDNLKIIKTAGGRSIFFADGEKVYKKDASGREEDLYDFYRYLDNKPDLLSRFPKFYGIVKIDRGLIESLIKSSPFPLYQRAQMVSDVNKLLCMENMCSYFTSPPWVLDLKMASPRTAEKYHKSRGVHEFSIHGMYIPSRVTDVLTTSMTASMTARAIDKEITFDHKMKKDLDYDDFNQVYGILSDFFPSSDLISKLITEVDEIEKMFIKYDFTFDCSLLVMHDTKRMIVKIIDCSMNKDCSTGSMGPSVTSSQGTMNVSVNTGTVSPASSRRELSPKNAERFSERLSDSFSERSQILVKKKTNEKPLKRLAFLKDLLIKIKMFTVFEKPCSSFQ